MHENYIKELQRGSYSDFNNLYNLYVDRLYGFVYNLTRSSDMTEEIVQEVFLKVWQIIDFCGVEGELASEANKTYVVIRIAGVLSASVKVPKSYLRVI